MKQFCMIKKIRSLLILSLLFFVYTNVSAYDLVVAQDGSGNYTTVQAAINAAPNNSAVPFTIFVKNGKYREKISVASTKTFIQLIGESVANVFIYYDDPATVLGTQNSASFSIMGNDFTAMNITFANTFGDGSQAVAVLVNADRAAFKNCRFLGNQDTVYLKGSGTPRDYFRNCYIDGNVDFIFGSAIAVFDSCVVYAKARTSTSSSFITAPNTPSGQAYGFVFRDTKLPNNTGGTSYYLSRPWPSPSEAQTNQKTVYLSCLLSSHIQPAGWTTWDANTIIANLYYGEYNSKYFNGTPVDVSQRVSWSHQLTQSDSATYTFANMFGSWDPCSVMAGFCNATNGGDIAVSNFRGTKGTSTSTFNWNISWPISGIQYDLYRSSNNVNFSIINTQTSVNDTAVNFNYSESIPPPGQTYYYYVRASKAGYNPHITDTISISSTPTITVTGTLGSFVQGVGIPSSAQSYIVSGASLTNDIIITPPAGYELSSNSGTNWYNSSTPIVLSPVSGNVANTTILVRLNASSAGTYSGNITHTSTGAASVNLAVTGNVQSTPLTVSVLLEQWSFTTNNQDSAAVRAAGVVGTVPTFNRLYVSNGTTVPAVPAYSLLHGQAYGASSNGDGTWTTAVGGPGGNLNRSIYEQFTITAASTHSLRVDSLILNSSFYNTNSGTKMAIVYSKTGFTTADSTDVTGVGGFASPITLNNETSGTSANNYRIAFNGATGINLASGETLTFRIYNSCSSGSAGRYGKIKNLYILGLATINPVVGDYRSHQTGDWTDVNTWERYDGTTWVTPAPTYPVYNNSQTITIQNAHTVTISATLANGGSGYIHLTKINQGGQLIVNNGATLNFANDGVLATTDLQVDGTLTALGQLGTNGNVSILVNGTFVYSGTGINLSNAGDTVRVGPLGTYQHNANSNSTPNIMICQPGATLLISGITSNQTGIFKTTSTYGNIVWNCPSQGGYYAFRSTLTNNVLGSFTVMNTGTTYLTFANANAKVTLPGGFYQTGGTVKFIESGAVNDTLSVGGDFNITGGTFSSNASGGAYTFTVNLTGTNKTINYSQSGNTNTNWNVNGVYTLVSNLVLPTSGYGVTVNGTLNAAAFIISGAGNFTMSPASTFSSASATGLDGNITVSGTKSFGTTGNFIFNGSAAQSTGALIPAAINSLTINNSSNVSLGGNTALAGPLTFTAGKLKLGVNNISTNSIVGSTSSNYVVTDGDGSLKINNIATGTTTFPVGPGTGNYNPVTLSNTGTPDNFSVKVKNTFDNPLPDPSKAVNDQWTITEETPGGTNATVGLSWIIADQASNFNPAASNVIRFNGSAWVATPATVTGAGTVASPYTATASGFTAFSPFGVSNAGALPLTLISFNASFDGGKVKASWTSSNEINIKKFYIQRSSDANNFTDAGNVDPKKNGIQNDYLFTDVNPLQGISYYRLKIEDRDGSVKYSNVVTINNTKAGQLTIFPNPVKDNLIVTHAKALPGAMIEMYAADGKLVNKQTVTKDAIQTNLNASSLTTGSYHLVFINGTDVQHINFIKK